MNNPQWARVTTEQPCPICGKPDWCGRSGKVVRCMRVSDASPGWRFVKADGEGTVFRPELPRQRQSARTRADTEAGWATKAKTFEAALTKARAKTLCQQLHVTVPSLKAVGVGWHAGKHVYTFPERNGRGIVIGIATRRPADGMKAMIKGSRRGLTIPTNLDQTKLVLIVVEGPTDVLAGLSMGLQVIGRPSAHGGVEHLAELLETWTGDVIILGENDQKDDGEWPGRNGAIKTTSALARRLARPIGWALPPDGCKDLRDWVRLEASDLSDEQSCAAAGQRILEAIRTTVTTVQETDAQGSAMGDQERPPSQADLLLAIGTSEDVELFHTPGGVDAEAFATIKVAEHLETWPIQSKGFRGWLLRRFWIAHKKAPSAESFKAALNTLAGMAMFEGPEHEVAVRLASRGREIFVDLCDENWSVIRITAAGRQVIPSRDVPIRFVRRKGMLPLPTPIRSGSIGELRLFINVPDDDDWRLLVAFIIMCYHPRGPYPILCVNGEQGSAKSTLCRFVRALIDPNRAMLRRPPRDSRDVMVSARNGWLIAYSNLSEIPVWLSDTLCALCYGEGFGTRELYTDADETIFDAGRPIIVNGIEDLMSRSDFADRCIHLVLPRIDDEQRRTDDELDAAFAEAAGRIFGSILDAVACALRNISGVQLRSMPRMANFAAWVVAAEPALPWEPGGFLASYLGNRRGVNASAIEAAAIGTALLQLLHPGEWTGTATELLRDLDSIADEKTRKLSDWPKAPNALSGKLRRLAPNLRQLGIEVDFDRETGRGRTRSIALRNTGSPPSAPSEPSERGGSPMDVDNSLGRSADDVEPPRTRDRPGLEGTSRLPAAEPDDLDDADGRQPVTVGLKREVRASVEATELEHGEL